MGGFSLKRPFVEALARQLGCGCPDEVFESIRSFVAPAPVVWSVVIGERLVLCIMNASDVDQAPLVLERLRAHRDRLGLNRVRLILSGSVAVGGLGACQAACADERMHVHVVSVDALGALQ